MKRLINILFSSILISSILLVLVQPMTATAQKKITQNHRISSNQKVIKNEIHLKIDPSYSITFKKNLFVGDPADQVSRLNDILSVAKSVKADKLITATATNPTQKQVLNAVDGYYKVKLAKDADIESISNELKGLPIVETAYGAPMLAPKPSANYQDLQTYRNAAPRGVNTTKAATFPGGKGDNVKIVDVEYSWNTNHEDLSKAKNALVANGTPLDPWTDNNHGTAALGEMIADDNGFGVTGITPNANLELINAYNQERGYDLVTSLYIAALTTKPGDVILVEQQIWGPTDSNNDWVPVEWVPEYYDIIKALTDLGRIVVEPAGNGNQNLDDATYYGNTFPLDKPDSGAIIVGAGENCDGSAPLLGRTGSSTFGSRVNLQGPGDCVTTTGYGWLSALSANSYYTSGFNGTSSATPVVAACAASLSSTYKEMNAGATLTPLQVRDILMKSGTKQNLTTGTNSGNIGNYPNLAKALLYSDTTKPSTPTNFTASLNSQKKPYLKWNPSVDNYKIKYYQIFRNGRFYKKVTTTEFTDTNVWQGVTYKYKILAVDYVGNKSPYTPYQLVSVL